MEWIIKIRLFKVYTVITHINDIKHQAIFLTAANFYKSN
jgi:hypothetical protein